MATDTEGDRTKKKPLLEDMLHWSEQALPEWQRDALRRLFQRGSEVLTPADYDELYALMKKSNGLIADKDVAAKPWAKGHLPNTGANNQHAILKGMRELKHVNRIAGGQTLAFASQGMTVVYGGNGSGKSGYSRVLKRACRARDQSESIHPDATEVGQTGKVPEAVFDVEVEGKPQAVSWALNKTAPDELATIAVFDGKCARAYLTNEGDVAYIPYGLDILASLANKVLPELERMLSAEIARLDVDPSVLDGLRGETKVGVLIDRLGPQTDQKALLELAQVTPDEVKRLNELQKALAEEDPRSTAKKVKLEAQRLRGLSERIDAACRKVNDEIVSKLKGLDLNNIDAKKAVAAAAQLLRSGETLLPGTGEDIWRRMYEAARKYSLEVAYPDHVFPHTGDGAVCPLCQQDLGQSGERIKRFEKYLQEDVAKASEGAKKALEVAVDGLRIAGLGFELDEALVAELAGLHAELPERVLTLQNRIDERRRTILACTTTHEWSGIPSLESGVGLELSKHAKALLEKADALEKASDIEKRKVLMAERAELQARVSLNSHLKKAQKLLSNIKLKATLEGCRKELKTTGISTKAKAFSESAITAALREALEDEFKKLGGVPFELKLADRNDKGRTKYKLQMAATAGFKLEDILSEGEQRAVAIGAFLAEIGLAGHKGGVVFDDPVSSLDHIRKSHIARRLVEEARNRQVIVFTHDLVFLTMLQFEAEKMGTSCGAHWLERDVAGRPGKVKLDDSPAGTKSYRDTKLAEATIKKAEALGGEERVSALRHAAGQLRRTLEEIVPLYLLKGVVERWRENLMITKLPAIHWDNAIADEIISIFEELSRHIEGHSHTEAYSGDVPEVGELKSLVARVDAVIKDAKKQRS